MKKLSRIVLALATVTFISCGDNKKEKEEEESFTIGDHAGETSRDADIRDTETREADEASSGDEDVVEITITGNDQMRFNKNEIRVKPGQTVRITLEHVGEMEKNVMGHNWILLEEGTDVDEFGQSAVQYRENDFIPEDTNQIIAHTELLGGGESDTIEFEAPEAGTYDYICSFPGHYSVMNGKFIVEE